jgi:hypothetical protein
MAKPAKISVAHIKEKKLERSWSKVTDSLSLCFVVTVWLGLELLTPSGLE